jgi:anti-sigma B factor antagonist
MEKFKSEVCLDNGRAIIFLRGELDLAAAECLEELLNAVVGDGWDVDLDLGRVSFIDSTGLHVLLAAHGAAVAGGVRVSIVNASTCVDRILELTNTATVLRRRRPVGLGWNPFADSMVEVYETSETARQASG